MSEKTKIKALGGIAPFGYRWKNGSLSVDQNEAPIRKLIYELFLKHRRKKTVANVLNDLGYRTRNASLFSDTTIDRLLRDTTAKGVRVVDGKTTSVEPIISSDIWERVNNILGGNKYPKQSSQLFSGIVYCSCGGKMIVPGNKTKYVCIDCRQKILIDDLEGIFCSHLKGVVDANTNSLVENWEYLTRKERRIVAEQICAKIVIGRDTIHIEFNYSLNSVKTPPDEQQNETGNERPLSVPATVEATTVSGPLISEADAATFLGISKITMARKRKAKEIGHFRLGHRILYSKEKHLLPYLKEREK